MNTIRKSPKPSTGWRLALLASAFVQAGARRTAGRDGGINSPSESTTDGRYRGREARVPSEIPRRGWWDVLVRVKNEMNEDNFSMIAAGVAFYGFLAVFPALAAFVSIYGLVNDPVDLQQHMSSIETLLPSDAANLINQELSRIVQSNGDELGWGLLGGIALALWSAAKGMKVMFETMNIAYDETERRGFFQLNAMAVLLTLGAILMVVLFLGLIVGIPILLERVSLGRIAANVVDIARWPLLALCAMAGLAVLYRYGPSRDQSQWRWITWGSVAATIIWVIGSLLFSFYVTHFASYNKTYGSLGVVVILMTWFLLGAYSVLLGAKMNAEMEHQTTVDTTVGKAEPLGHRGAHVADTVGYSAEEGADATRH
jgi:membrane protein